MNFYMYDCVYMCQIRPVHGCHDNTTDTINLETDNVYNGHSRCYGYQWPYPLILTLSWLSSELLVEE